MQVRCGQTTIPWDQFVLVEHPLLHLWQQHHGLMTWLKDVVTLCTPRSLVLCDGSEQEYAGFCQELVQKGVFTPLDPEKRPGSFWCHSDPSDVARVEESTYICSATENQAGPTNHWYDPIKMKALLNTLFQGCMEGRDLYVVPFCMGPIGSEFALIGIEITDSLYVVCNMKIMTHMGVHVLQALGSDGFFIPCLHSVGCPLPPGAQDVSWPCNHKNKYIVHFPEEKTIFSYGSGYGGNALLGKKSVALRIASLLGKQQGWLAEHMLLIGVTNPEGKKKYMAAAFPSHCGKTNLALLSSTLPGWKVECIGDDIAWIRIGKDGRFYALNPEAGFFGVAPGTSWDSNPVAMQMIAKNTIFTNVAYTADHDIWWEGLTKTPPDGLIDWKGNPYDYEGCLDAAHPNARFTVPFSQCPIADVESNNPMGVPLSAILFGGRRSCGMPLVMQSFSWQHGVFLGATISSKTTAASIGDIGKLRHDPFGMTPFCGYHMGEYFSHWLAMGQRAARPPSIFYVNWFGKDDRGQFVWPGFGENIRVLKWIFEVEEGTAGSKDTPIGKVPKKLDLSGLISPVSSDQLFPFSYHHWHAEVEELERYFALFGDKLPSAFQEELDSLRQQIESI